MNLWDSLGGMVCLRLTGADPEETLRRAGIAGITVLGIRRDPDPMSRCFEVHRRHYAPLLKLADSRGDQLEITARKGVYWKLKALGGRPVLLIGIVFLLIMTAFLPTRILFVEVEGSGSVPAKRIIAAADAAGLGFGASRRSLRSEKLKNALLEAIPELQWVGVNTKGCLAAITVRERQQTEPIRPSGGVASIVAVRDGVIREITVERGSGMCKVGEAVKAGQVLISGYTDCGLSIRATRASGEVYASTVHNLTAVTPSDWKIRGEEGDSIKKISVIIGKKRINLFQSSGIFHTGCVKMYEEYDLALPGGFSLPVTLSVEVWQSYDDTTVSTASESAASLLSDFGKAYLADQMVAGQILSRSEITETGEGVLRMRGVYACREMIGQIRNEEIIQ